jgi:hypothetical protein
VCVAHRVLRRGPRTLGFGLASDLSNRLSRALAWRPLGPARTRPSAAEQPIASGHQQPASVSVAARRTGAFGVMGVSRGPFKVDFDSLAWQPSSTSARYKVHREGARQLRLVEFTSEFVEPHWCEKGHIGLVLTGTLEIDFGGQLVWYSAGSGIVISPGPSSAHKARPVTPIVRLRSGGRRINLFQCVYEARAFRYLWG